MAPLNVYYARGHGDEPVTVTTVAEVDELVERISRESPERAPILMEVHLSEDPFGQGLDVGLKTDRGVLRYSGGEWPEGVYSVGEERPGEGSPAYFYMDTYTEFPANSEVPLEVVREAVRDFLTTDGGRSTRVSWQLGR